MKKNLISIIVPVYNVELYLRECICSILRQSYENLEVILVNDGSTDSCPSICDEFQLDDERIKVIHQKNSGLSAARNVGLEIATGNYICFVDSDDLIAPNFCELLIHTALYYNSDIVECDFAKFSRICDLGDLNIVASIPVQTCSAQSALEMLMKEQLKQTVWNKIYRASIIGDKRFPENKINEDEFWTYKIFGSSEKVSKISQSLYFYRQQPESIMGRRYNIGRLDGLAALEQRINYMHNHFPELENLAIKIYCLGSMWHYQMIAKNTQIDPYGIHRKKIINSVRSYKQFSTFKHWNIRDFFWYHFFVLSPKSYVALRNHIIGKI